MIQKTQIDKLFSRLRSYHLSAKQDFLCCQSCAMFEIEKEIQAKQQEGKELPPGYVFYHRADTEFAFGEPKKIVGGSAIGTEMKNDLHLSFGSMSGDESESIKVGQLICKAVKDSGLVWKWDGDPDKRIIVRNKPRRVK